jgi:hypothetical protein
MITNNQAKQIQTIQADLADLIRECNPTEKKDWIAYERLVNAHKELRTIDTDAFLQIGMPLEV